MMMRSLKAAFAGLAAAIACLAPADSRADFVYGVTYFDNQLVTVDTTTGAATVVGSLSTPMSAYGLSNVNGKLYTFDSTSDLVRQINPATGGTLASFNIGLTPGSFLGEGAMAFQSSTVGFLTSSLDPNTLLPVNGLYRFDLGTGKSTLVAPQGTTDTLEALAFGPSGTLYGLGKLDGNLYTVNTATGVLTAIGNVGFNVGSPIGGLAFEPNGQLYATIDDALYTLNTANGLATPVSLADPTNPPFGTPSGVFSISGITASGAVPEPSSLALCAIFAGLGCACRGIRRRPLA